MNIQGGMNVQKWIHGATRRAEITNHCRAITFAVGGADEDKNRLPDKSGANRT